MDCFECMSVCERETVLSMSCISQKRNIGKSHLLFSFFFYTYVYGRNVPIYWWIAMISF